MFRGNVWEACFRAIVFVAHAAISSLYSALLLPALPLRALILCRFAECVVVVVPQNDLIGPPPQLQLVRWWCCLLKTCACRLSSWKPGKWRRYPWGCFGYLPSFAALFVFARRTLMASCPWCSTTFRLGEASSCWPRSQRALFRPWSLLPSCHQKKSWHQSPPKSGQAWRCWWSWWRSS